jgi:hypothetical protein
MKAVDLAHARDDCTGGWRLTGPARRRSIICTRCSVEHVATPEARRAAIDENCAGLVLRRLAAEGAVVRQADGRRR